MTDKMYVNPVDVTGISWTGVWGWIFRRYSQQHVFLDALGKAIYGNCIEIKNKSIVRGKTEPIVDCTTFKLEKEMATTPVFLPRKSRGQSLSLVGYSPWCCKETDMT